MTTDTPRRAALGGALAAALAGLAAPALAATPNDADLIALCDQVAAVENEWRAVLATNRTIADEHRNESRLAALEAERERLFDLLPEPTSLDGAKALARVALLTAPRSGGGKPICADMSEWMLYAVAEFLTEGKVTVSGYSPLGEGYSVAMPYVEDDATSEARTEAAINSMSPDTLRKLAATFRQRQDEDAKGLARIEARLREIGA